jgi:prevent-host-death family protein
MKTIDASKARKTFARVLENVRERKENVVIVRYGRPIAALVPIGQLSPGERKRLKAGARR